jgi:hypothetical protein
LLMPHRCGEGDASMSMLLLLVGSFVTAVCGACGLAMLAADYSAQ